MRQNVPTPDRVTRANTIVAMITRFPHGAPEGSQYTLGYELLGDLGTWEPEYPGGLRTDLKGPEVRLLQQAAPATADLPIFEYESYLRDLRMVYQAVILLHPIMAEPLIAYQRGNARMGDVIDLCRELREIWLRGEGMLYAQLVSNALVRMGHHVTPRMFDLTSA